MKEIRHYIKRIADFPKSLVNMENLSPEALWNDTFFALTKSPNNTKVFISIDWLTIKQDKNLLGLHAVLCFLISEPIWKEEKFDTEKLILFLKDRLPKLSSQVKPYTEWISDNERSEELVRALFCFLKILPAGESEKYFADRLRSIDTLERIQILEESRKAQERAQEILRKIKQAEEEEAASKYNRE